MMKVVIFIMIIVFFPHSLYNCHYNDNFLRLTVTTAMVEAELTAHSLLNLHKVRMAIISIFGVLGVAGGCLEGAWGLVGGCLVGVWEVFGMSLYGVWGCFEGVSRVFVGCLGCFWG